MELKVDEIKKAMKGMNLQLNHQTLQKNEKI